MNPECFSAKSFYSSTLEKINRVVEATPFLEPVQREFYQIMRRERKEKILDFSMDLMRK